MDNNQQIFTIEKTNNELGHYSFEDAIALTGFGKYNIILILMCGLGLLGVITESIDSGIIIPSAKCDLELTSSMKGVLNTVVLIGILLSSQIWGYLGDTRGRRAMMILPVFISVLVTICASMAVNFYWLVGLRFISGLLLSSSACIVYAYVSEFNAAKHRLLALTLTSSFVSLATLVVPAIAWIVLPMDWSFDIEFLQITYKPWRLLIVLCGLPNLLFVLILMCYPESPRFLLQEKQPEKALDILRNIYSFNTGRDVSTFPVKKLLHIETTTATTSNDQKPCCLSSFYKQLIPIFLPPLWMKTLLISTLQFGSFFAGLGVYNWIPHILNAYFEAPSQTSICEILNPLNNQNVTIESHENSTQNAVNCVATVNITMLCSSFYLGLVVFITYLLVSCLVKRTGNKIISIFMYIISGTACCFMHMVHTNWIAILLMCFFVLNLITIGLTNSFTPDMFPTKYRAIAISVSFTIGRIGSVVGSNVMAVLLDSHCSGAFYLTGGILLFCGLLSFQLPSHNRNK